MPRPKSERHSSDLDAEIARLEQERKRLIQSEDQRRGAIIRELLSGSSGNSVRSILKPLVSPRDSFLFGLEGPATTFKPVAPRSHASRTVAASTSRQQTEAAP